MSDKSDHPLRPIDFFAGCALIGHLARGTQAPEESAWESAMDSMKFREMEMARSNPKLPALGEFEFSTRVRRVFHRLQITSTEELVQKSYEDFLHVRNFAEGSWNELNRKLAARGLSLRGYPSRGRFK